MKLFLKSSVVCFTFMMIFTGTAFAQSPVCGEAQNDTWLAPEVIQEQVQALGYTIESMGVSEGNCYQLTGMNADGKGVTTYLDPKTGGIVQEDVVE